MKGFPILIFLLMNTSLLAQQSPMNKTVSITAKAEVEVNPDEVVYGINISQKRATFEEAYNALDNYNVQKNYRWKDSKRIDDGFIATSRLEAKNELDTRKINKVLSRFAKGSPDLNLNVGFAISKDLMEKSNGDLLTKAIKRSKKKASRICDALDKDLGGIISVEYNEVGSQRPVYYQKNMANARTMSVADESHSGIENVKEIKLDLSVHTVWSIE
jgi:uncharacterized protein YggE